MKNCPSYSPLTIERATPNSDWPLEVIMSENFNCGTGQSTLVNVLWAGYVHSYNVHSFNLRTENSSHLLKVLRWDLAMQTCLMLNVRRMLS